MFQVQEFAGGKWWPLQSFNTKELAEEYAVSRGGKVRIKKV